ncbi:FAD dependent oxidoreductase [Penicillium verrucosum]|uniref:FAD dependent oxidoreductase n=1 Tax=Penicillium verrucosum TaxID=60171 RepID=UPI00254593B7|nr:FAD dependent oxidoreductase [Penicillium verrucosum]KAJ5940145.1 FAD dependent oxidoreductase [Penicillium verrucosum]
MTTAKTDSILIVGAGVFGLSTALELNKRGYTDITVVDRFVPPSADGSSVDISRIIRADYADPIYSQMAREAYSGWTTEYKDQYFESGFALLSETPKNEYMEKSKAVIRAAGGKLDDLDDAMEIRKLYPSVAGPMPQAASKKLASKCTVAGISIIAGPRGTVISLRREGSRVVGVNLVGGQVLLASQVILSTGAWTNRLLNMGHAASSSGQPVGFIQLTEEEALEMRKIPVMINMSSGVFSFPPTPDTHVLKLARHGYGYATDMTVNVDGVRKSLSSPKFEGSNAATGYLPDDADESLRQGLRQFFPKLGDRPWMNRRLCWYTDTPNGDFIIDHHPTIQGLFMATGGAGHGFKFLPILGQYIADCFENKAPEALRQKWRMNPPQGDSKGPMAGDGSRGGPPLRKLSPLEQAKL